MPVSTNANTPKILRDGYLASRYWLDSKCSRDPNVTKYDKFIWSARMWFCMSNTPTLVRFTLKSIVLFEICYWYGRIHPLYYFSSFPDQILPINEEEKRIRALNVLSEVSILLDNGQGIILFRDLVAPWIFEWLGGFGGRSLSLLPGRISFSILQDDAEYSRFTHPSSTWSILCRRKWCRRMERFDVEAIILADIARQSCEPEELHVAYIGR
jgi:hypothetical protein